MEEERAAAVLPLIAGMTVEVMTMNNQITFIGKVEQYAGGVLTVRGATGGELPPVLFNREVKLHFFRRDQGIIAQASVCGSSPWVWKLDRLERLFGQEQRIFFRQSVKLDAKIQHMECSEPKDGLQQWGAPAACKILDVSAGGLRLSAREPFQEGERLLVTDVFFARGEKPFTFQCRVQRAWREGGNYLAGCQIEDLSEREQDRLLRAVFVVQRVERQTQKERIAQTIE